MVESRFLDCFTVCMFDNFFFINLHTLQIKNSFYECVQKANILNSMKMDPNTAVKKSI